MPGNYFVLARSEKEAVGIYVGFDFKFFAADEKKKSLFISSVIPSPDIPA